MTKDKKNLGSIDLNDIQKMITSLTKDSILNQNLNYDLNDLVIHRDKIELNESDIQYLTKKQQINYCIDPNWYPIEAIKDGKHVGISKDFIDIFENRLKIKFKGTSKNSCISSSKP